MPLSDADIVQENTGGFSATTGTASLPAGTTAGNTVLIVIGGAFTGIDPPPDGFELLLSEAQYAWLRVFIRSDVAAGENNWTLDVASGVTSPIAWVAYELSNLNLTNPLNAYVGQRSASAPADFSSGTTPANSAYDTVAFAFHVRRNDGGATVPTQSGHTGGFAERSEAGASNDIDAAVGLSVSRRYPGTVGSFESTATSTVTGPAAAGILVFASATSEYADPLIVHAGYEWGTTQGMMVGNVVAGQSNKVFDVLGAGTLGTNVIIETANARSGTYNLRLTATAGFAFIAWGQDTLGSLHDGVIRSLFIKPISGSGQVIVAGAVGTTFPVVRFLYDFAADRFGVAYETSAGVLDTVTWQAGTAAAGAYHQLEFYVSGFTDGTRHVEWRVDGVDQASPADATGTSGVLFEVQSGAAAVAGTFNIAYDDDVVSITPGDWPLTAHKVLLLRADNAATIGGVNPTTFRTFSANATVSGSWVDATARAAIRDLPPNLAVGTADGVTQVTAATGNYLEIPMETYTLGGQEAIAGARLLCPGWGVGNAPVAANLGFRAFTDAEVTLLAAANGNHGFGNNNTTAPAWLCRMINPLGGWTQARLNALAVRVGFSSDATPDIGVHAVYVELAVRELLPPVSLADSGSGTDTLRPAAAAPLADQGQGADTLRPAATVSLAESAAGADSLSVVTPPVSVALTDAGTAAEHLCHDGGPAGAPDCILDETNLAGDLTRLWDDPTAPDANWLTALDPTLATDLRVSFPTPATAPGAGGPTIFQAWVRKQGTGADPDLTVELWEAGVFVKELTSVAVTSSSGQLVTATLTPADLAVSNGSQVELRLSGGGSGALWPATWPATWGGGP